MADPLSIVVSAFSLIQVAAAVRDRLYGVFCKLQEATQDLHGLKDDVRNLQDIVSEIQTRCPKWRRHPSFMLGNDKLISVVETQLESLVDDLTPVEDLVQYLPCHDDKAIKRCWKRTKIAWHQRDTDKISARLQKHKHSLQLVLCAISWCVICFSLFSTTGDKRMDYL
jgi:hypothetical protein